MRISSLLSILMEAHHLHGNIEVAVEGLDEGLGCWSDPVVKFGYPKHWKNKKLFMIAPDERYKLEDSE